jgi:hypothetical protein
VNGKRNDFEIADIYYADCHQDAGTEPLWSTTRTGQQLTDERAIGKLRTQLQQLRRKRKLEFTFGDETIEVDHPRNANVRAVLQHILALPTSRQSLDELQQYGDVLAQKYLRTPYSRTRLFMIARVLFVEEIRLFMLVANLTPEFAGECIQPDSLDFTSRIIPNLIGDWKKGAVYPALSDGRRNENAILIYDSERTKYYPRSLECILRQAPDMEARSVLGVLGQVCTPTPDQVAALLRHLRAIEDTSFGSDELVDALETSGIAADPKQVREQWRKQFNYSDYRVPPSILSWGSVDIIIKIDEFEIKCPLSYYPDRIEHTEEGGYHYLTVRGRDYRELQAGSSHVRFASRDD